MEKQQLHRGRPVDHIPLVVKGGAASRRFHDAAQRSAESVQITF